MSPGEVLWKHHVDQDGLVHLRWSTDQGASWERAAVKTKTVRGKLTVTELRLPNPTTKSLRELRFSALEQYLRQRLPQGGGTAARRDVTVGGATAGASATARGGRVILSHPETPRYGDAFYKLFATAYLDCTARGLPPRPTLAADAGVSRETIARWAKEARRRKFLSSDGRGKVSF